MQLACGELGRKGVVAACLVGMALGGRVFQPAWKEGAASGRKGLPACFGGVRGEEKGVTQGGTGRTANALAETQRKTGLEVLELHEL